MVTALSPSQNVLTGSAVECPGHELRYGRIGYSESVGQFLIDLYVDHAGVVKVVTVDENRIGDLRRAVPPPGRRYASNSWMSSPTIRTSTGASKDIPCCISFTITSASGATEVRDFRRSFTNAGVSFTERVLTMNCPYAASGCWGLTL